jgi:glutaredoxin 3
MLKVYSKDNCPFCLQAKAFLEKKGIDFEEVRVDQNPQAREFIVNAGHRTVPQIYQDGKLFVEGGFQGLSKLTEDQLKEKLSVTQ